MIDGTFPAPPIASHINLELVSVAPGVANISFLRGMTSETGRVTAQGRVTKPGSRTAFVEADITDAAGRVLATATSTCLVFTP